MQEAEYLHEVFNRYREALGVLFREVPRDDFAAVAGILGAARWRARIFVCGNGGSAATADHFACDLSKSAGGFSAIPLGGHLATLTALGNDEGYNRVFARQLHMHALPGDMLFVISVSGNSPNIVEAVRVAQLLHINTVGLFGNDGGTAARMCDVCVVVPSTCYELVEDIHLAICHMLTGYFREQTPE